MTEREVQHMGDHFEHLSDWFLSVFSNPKNQDTIRELAANELLVRRLRKEKLDVAH